MRHATVIVTVLTLFAMTGCEPSSQSKSDKKKEKEKKDMKKKKKTGDQSQDSPSESSGSTVKQDDEIMESMNEAADHVDE